MSCVHIMVHYSRQRWIWTLSHWFLNLVHLSKYIISFLFYSYFFHGDKMHYSGWLIHVYFTIQVWLLLTFLNNLSNRWQHQLKLKKPRPIFNALIELFSLLPGCLPRPHAAPRCVWCERVLHFPRPDNSVEGHESERQQNCCFYDLERCKRRFADDQDPTEQPQRESGRGDDSFLLIADC